MTSVNCRLCAGLLLFALTNGTKWFLPYSVCYTFFSFWPQVNINILLVTLGNRSPPIVWVNKGEFIISTSGTGPRHQNNHQEQGSFPLGNSLPFGLHRLPEGAQTVPQFHSARDKPNYSQLGLTGYGGEESCTVDMTSGPHCVPSPSGWGACCRERRRWGSYVYIYMSSDIILCFLWSQGSVLTNQRCSVGVHYFFPFGANGVCLACIKTRTDDEAIHMIQAKQLLRDMKVGLFWIN